MATDLSTTGTTLGTGGVVEGYQGILGSQLSAEQKKLIGTHYNKFRKGFLVTWVFSIVFLVMSTIVGYLAAVYLAKLATTTDVNGVVTTDKTAQNRAYGSIVLLTMTFVVIVASLGYYFAVARGAETALHGQRVKVFRVPQDQPVTVTSAPTTTSYRTNPLPTTSLI